MSSLLSALIVVAVLLTALLPSLAAMMRLYRDSAVEEELLRQGTLVDEVMFLELRYGQDVKVISPQKIEFFRESNGGDGGRIKSGYQVKQDQLCRLLSNGQGQPLTEYSGLGPAMDIRVRPYGRAECFSSDGRRIEMSIQLYDRISGRQWPCQMTVVPLEREREALL